MTPTKKKAAKKKAAKKKATKKSARKTPTKKKRTAVGKAAAADKPRCGLCGKTGRLMRTECCGNWICDDEDSYVMFSYARNSCARNHRRYTLCGFHDAEQHDGSWPDCPKCRDEIEAEMYAYFGTNEYNFTKLENPPAFEPKICSRCGREIVLAEGGYSQLGDDYTCMDCTSEEIRKLTGGRGL